MLADKQAVLDREDPAPGCRRVPVRVNLEDDEWPGALTAAGFDQLVPAVFIAEGLSWYLTEYDNDRLLDHLAALSAPGSLLGIDMLSADYLTNPAVVPLLERLAAWGISWRFGTNDPAGFLGAHGWRADVNDFDVVGRRFGRWPPPGVQEDIAARAAAASRSVFISARRAT